MKLAALFIGIVTAVAGYLAYQGTGIAIGAPLSQFISTQLAGSPIAGYVLSTNGTTNSWIPAAGGGSSKWTDSGTVIYPTTGESVSASFFSGTSTTATSTFVNASSTQFCLGSDCRTSWPTGGGGGSISTSSVPTPGHLAYWTSASALSSVATGTLTETVSGLELSATRGLVGGAAILSLTSGFTIPTTTDITNWNNAFSFYTTPSTRITAGTGVDWSGNTLNGVYTAGDALTLTGEDFDFDGGASPAGELGGTWTSPTIDDSLAVTSWNLTTPTLTSFFGTPCTGNNFLQDIGDTGTFTCAAASGGSSNWTIVSGGLRTSTTTDFAEAAYIKASSTTATSTFLGAVGVGTSTPVAKFAVSGNSYISGNISILTGVSLLGSSSNISLGTNYLSGDGDDEGVYISGAGFVGIATTTPGSKLTVSGDSLVTATSTTKTLIVRGGTSATSTAYIYSTTASIGGQIILEDADGAGCTGITALNGTLTSVTVTCPTEY